MHGMINRAFQGFVVSTYGADTWQEISAVGQLPEGGFEAMEHYPDIVTLNCLDATVDVLGKHSNAVLEDLGTYLVTDPALEPLRRLLRFGGATFAEFLLSLDEMPERARLAIPDLELPQIAISAEGGGRYVISATWPLPGIAPLMMGSLRAMADDYGVLVMMELSGQSDIEERLQVQIFDADFTEGKAFSLGRAEP